MAVPNPSKSCFAGLLAIYGEDELTRLFNTVAADLDLQVSVTAQQLFITNGYALSFRIAEKRGIDHILGLDFRIKEFIKRITAVLDHDRSIQFGIYNPNAYVMLPVNLDRPTADKIMSTVRYEEFMWTPQGALSRGVFSLHFIETAP